MLTVEDLNCYYDTSHVLQGASMEVGSSEVVGLLGRNGMGKTTLVRAVMGIRPPDLRAGRVWYDGADITREESFAISRLGVGYVPQGRRIFGSLSVQENLTVIGRSGPTGAAWTLDTVYDLFPRLADRRQSAGTTLSGGEQQMLAIARALMTNPRLLVMDEPSEGLAPVVIDMLEDRLRELVRAGLSILLVEQNLGLALGLSDRIYVLGEGGRMVWDGLPDELANDAELATTHLGV